MLRDDSFCHVSFIGAISPGLSACLPSPPSHCSRSHPPTRCTREGLCVFVSCFMDGVGFLSFRSVEGLVPPRALRVGRVWVRRRHVPPLATSLMHECHDHAPLLVTSYTVLDSPLPLWIPELGWTSLIRQRGLLRTYHRADM